MFYDTTWSKFKMTIQFAKTKSEWNPKNPSDDEIKQFLEAQKG